MVFTKDVWSEIIKYISICEFKSLSLTCSTLHKLIRIKRYSILRILWKWKNKTRIISKFNINTYYTAEDLTFKYLARYSSFAFFVDHHLTKLPMFLKKTIKNMNAKYQIKQRRASYFHHHMKIEYSTDIRLRQINCKYLEIGTYTGCVVKLLIIMNALQIDISTIFNDNTTQYSIWNPGFITDIAFYEHAYQPIKEDEKSIQRLMF